MSTSDIADTPDSSTRNMATHVASLSFTKLADGLIDPKLVLSWLLTSLGAPAALIGLLAAAFGTRAVILAFAVQSALGAIAALRLQEVQRR